MAGEFAGKVTFVKVDLTDSAAPSEAATKYDVKTLPATLIFKDGKLVGQVGGKMESTNSTDASAIKAEVEKAL